MKHFPSLTSACLATISLVVGSAAFAERNSEPEVNIYSYRQPHLIQPLLDRFTRETGIKVRLLSIQKGMVARLQEEDELSPADAILTVDIGRLASIVEKGFAQPVFAPEIDANVPADLRDPNGDWTGLTTRARIVYASRERVSEGEITTYEDLAHPRWRGRICTRSGRHHYSIALLAAMIEHHGVRKAKKWLRDLKANLARRPQGNDRAQVKAIWAGECDISIGNTYYMGKMLEDPKQRPWAESVWVTFPTFEGGGTHVNVSGVLMTKYAPNPEAARSLIRFLVSRTAQRIYAEANYEYPVNPDVPALPLVRSWGSFDPDPVSLSDIASRRAQALRIVDQVKFDN